MIVYNVGRDFSMQHFIFILHFLILLLFIFILCVYCDLLYFSLLCVVRSECS